MNFMRSPLVARMSEATSGITISVYTLTAPDRQCGRASGRSGEAKDGMDRGGRLTRLPFVPRSVKVKPAMSDALQLRRAQTEIGQLYEGDSPEAHRFRYALIAFDFVTLLFIVAT